MAERDEDTTSSPFTAAEAFRRMQELGTQLTGAARSMAEDFATSAAAAPFVEPMARWGERTVELSTLWVAPMRAMLEEQQELIDAVSSWAEEQRKLADRFSELAQRHRELTEQVLAAVTPTLDQVDLLAGRAKPAGSPKKR